MAQGLLTPLQLEAAAALLNNTGILPLPTALTTALTSFNSGTPVANFLTAVSTYTAQSFATASTLASLLTIGNTTIPALGDSIPSADTNLTPVSTSPAGFSGLIAQTGNAYLGAGSAGQFALGFMAVQGWINSTNTYINSAVNAQTYLGPTFTNMNALVTNQISEINPNFDGFGTDLANQGNLVNLANLPLYGTPAGLLQQIAAVSGVSGGFPDIIQEPLLAAGLTAANIKTLLTGQNTVTVSEFNALQRLAYSGLAGVQGAALTQVLSILDVTTPGITSLADLLDMTKVFPNSYTTMQTPTPNGPVPIFGVGNSVNMNIVDNVNIYLPQETGCDELAKVIPPAIAVSNKAMQTSLQQVTGIADSTLSQLAETVKGFCTDPWDITQTYFANDCVANGAPIPTFYRAQQDVPAGININNTAYWLPTTLGGLNTMSGLPLIEAQTTPISSSTASFFANTMATGSGPNGTITTCDVIGTAINYSNISAQLNIATAAMANIATLDASNIGNINSAYAAITAAANDAAVIANIAKAAGNITNVYNNANAAVAANVTALNSAFSTIGNILNTEKGYQNQAGVDYFNLPTGETTTVMSFVQQLPTYGTQTAAGGPAYFIEQVANTSIIGGQAIVGCLREGQNQQRLGDANLGLTYTPSTAPAVTPVPVVTPVY